MINLTDSKHQSNLMNIVESINTSDMLNGEKIRFFLDTVLSKKKLKYASCILQ